MFRKLFPIVALTAALLLAVSPATAITSGEPDGTRHPYVGLMVAQDAKGSPLWRCSGTLLSPTVFLTAGHCTESPATHAEIWFDADVQSGVPGNGYPNKGEAGGTPYTIPNYSFPVRDAGVVVLNKPYKNRPVWRSAPT